MDSGRQIAPHRSQRTAITSRPIHSRLRCRITQYPATNRPRMLSHVLQRTTIASPTKKKATTLRAPRRREDGGCTATLGYRIVAVLDVVKNQCLIISSSSYSGSEYVTISRGPTTVGLGPLLV